MDGMVAILVSKKKCLITKDGILLKKGVSKKNAIIKIKGVAIPKEINTNIYQCLFVNGKTVEHLPFYN
jgi:hypothetical protein